MLIEFDPDKDRINQLKHGVSLKLAERIDMRHALVVDDPRDFEGETRQRGYVTIDGRLFVFWFTWRGEVCRLIGIRKANQREVKRYGG